MKYSSEVANHFLYFLISCSSFLDCGLVPFAGKLVVSPSIDAGSVAMVLLVNTGKECENCGLDRKRLWSWQEEE